MSGVYSSASCELVTMPCASVSRLEIVAGPVDVDKMSNYAVRMATRDGARVNEQQLVTGAIACLGAGGFAA